MGSKINTNQASVRLGFVLGLCCLCWGSCWAKMACSFGCHATVQMNTPAWAMLRLCGVHVGNPVFLGNPNAKKNFKYNMYIIKNNVSTFVPL